MPFIVSDASGKPCISPEMRDILASAASNKPLVVVAIAGVYRSGKSYLMERLARASGVVGQGSGFPLGSTVQSKTKGIWAWLRYKITESFVH